MPAVSRKREFSVESSPDATRSEPRFSFDLVHEPPASDGLTARGLQIHLASRVAGTPSTGPIPGQTVRRMLGTIGMAALSAWVIAVAVVTAVSAILSAIA